MTDWKEQAKAAWDSESWRSTAREYHNSRPKLSAIMSTEVVRARRLLDDNVTLERAWHELNNNIKSRAADFTVEALMFSLRERGARALDEPDTRPRLAELSDKQVIEVGIRLQRLKPEIARAWPADEIESLMQLREILR
jgi:hypothetical protein